MTTTAVLGTGAIGTAAGSALLRAGYDVVAWNRTPDRAHALASAGARRAVSAAEAVDVSALVLVAVTDQAALGDVLEALDDLTGTVVVGLCTGTPSQVAMNDRQVRERGGTLLGAGVRSSPDAYASGAGSLLVSGPRPSYDEHRAALDLLGDVRWVGEQPQAAATLDLVLFGLWYDAQLGLLRAVGALAAAGVDPAGLVPDLAAQLDHVRADVAPVIDQLRTRSFPRGPADLREHLALLSSLRGERRLPLGDGGLGPAVERLQELVDAGRGGEGLTALLDA